MKKYLLTLLVIAPVSVLVTPIIAQAVLGDNVKNAVNNSSPETQDAVLQARMKAITTALNGIITAVTKADTAFQANTQFTADSKAQAQELTDNTIKELNEQITAVAGATSNEDLDVIRDAAIEELKSYEDEFKALLEEASITAYQQMIADANEVLKYIEELIPVLKAARIDTTELQAQVDLCHADITASDTAFYKAMDMHASADLKVSSQAIAKLAQDMAKLVEIADEMAQ